VDCLGENLYVFWKIHFQGLMVEWAIVIAAYAVFFIYLLKDRGEQ